jgi:putative sigma-54 modulation protein
MQVIVKGRNTHVPPRLKERATRKLERVQRFFDRIQSLEIEFSEEHNPRIADKHTVEVTLTTKAHVLRAHASGPDPSSAVDLVVAKLEGQVKRLKGKIVQRGGRKTLRTAGGRLPDVEELPAAVPRKGATPPLESAEGPEGPRPRTRRRSSS